jgi:hypothetical protein
MNHHKTSGCISALNSHTRHPVVLKVENKHVQNVMQIMNLFFTMVLPGVPQRQQPLKDEPALVHDVTTMKDHKTPVVIDVHLVSFDNSLNDEQKVVTTASMMNKKLEKVVKRRVLSQDVNKQPSLFS